MFRAVACARAGEQGRAAAGAGCGGLCPLRSHSRADQQLDVPLLLCTGRCFAAVVAEVPEPWLWAGAAETLLFGGFLQLLRLCRR